MDKSKRSTILINNTILGIDYPNIKGNFIRNPNNLLSSTGQLSIEPWDVTKKALG